MTSAPTCFRESTRTRLRWTSSAVMMTLMKTTTANALTTYLLATVAQVDRSGRHAGLVPIPEVRSVFEAAGWSREAFDTALLQAEHDYVVDLKTANDPRLLAQPELAIRRGQTYLQYVVAR